MPTLTIIQPDDWHIHLREGKYLATTVSHAAERFQRVLVMPNLKSPIYNVNRAAFYREAILNATPNKHFNPLMTLYLTDQTTPEEIRLAKASGIIFGCKLYPAGATTNSSFGVTNLNKLLPIFETMTQEDMPLLIHGETTDANVDIFDREAVFISNTLIPLIERFPHMRIVLEHITTKEAVDFVLNSSELIAATITAHHLLMNRNDLFMNGIRPHHYCLPVLKRRQHQDALVLAATSGSNKFFLGTDSAPHSQTSKESACGCAGIYTAHAAIELYCEVFEQMAALDRLEQFASFNGPDFYKLPRNRTKITLIKEKWQVPFAYEYANERLIPFRAGEDIEWKLIIT